MEKICEVNELHYSDYSEGKNTDDGDVMGWTDSKRKIPTLVTGLDIYMKNSGYVEERTVAESIKENEKLYEQENALRKTFDGDGGKGKGKGPLMESVEMMEIKGLREIPDIGLEKENSGIEEIPETKEVLGSSRNVKPLAHEGALEGRKKSVRWDAGPGGDIQESKLIEVEKQTQEPSQGKSLHRSLTCTDAGVKLDASQIKRVAKEIFNLYDDNDSGYLERAEIKQIWTDLMTELGKGMVPEDQLDQLITKYDTNGDGEFSMAEVKELLTPIIKQELKVNPRSGHLFFRDIQFEGKT